MGFGTSSYSPVIDYGLVFESIGPDPTNTYCRLSCLLLRIGPMTPVGLLVIDSAVLNSKAIVLTHMLDFTGMTSPSQSNREILTLGSLWITVTYHNFEQKHYLKP